ncbi:MAG: ABC transporter ATP-binding protein [Deltaproteobacteria bacterium]|nr:ABC transporter ATP-binding protein [Deltaproteobacteria bacterium]
MIEVKKLAKKYGDYTAVYDVSFSAAKGEIVGFLGPNGAGKTTTIRMLSTYLPPTSGSASIAGFDIAKQADQVRRNIGYLPENPPLYGEMTIREYLTFVARIKGVPKSAIQSRVAESIEKCSLGDVRNKLCQHLSRGFRQRAGIAQAIIHNPQVIILDEPTSGLDPRQIIDIRKMISSLAEQHTVILSTHILPEVQSICTKVVIVNQGRVVLESALADLTKGKTLEQVFLDCVSSEQLRPDEQASGAA